MVNMSYIPYDDLNDPSGFGRSFVKPAAQAVRGAVCGLYRNYQYWYRQGPGERFDVTGGLIESFWNNLCPEEPPYEPPLNDPPFKGGQCVCIKYQVTLEYRMPGENSWTAVGGAVHGEIREIGPHKSPGGYSGIGAFCRGHAHLNCQKDHLWIDFVGFGSEVGLNAQIRNLSVVRQDAQADNCGDLPVPPLPVAPPPPPGDLKPNVTFDFGGNQFNMPLNISPQIHVGGRYGFNPDVDINFTLDADANFTFEGPQFSFNPEFNFKPKLEFKFGPEGVNVNYGGDTYNYNYNPSSDPNLKPEEGEEVEEGEEEKDKSGLKFVKVTLTKLPDKVQYGNDNRNIYFAGWIEFLVGESALPRIQVNFQESIFPVPAYSDGYSLTFTNGAKGRVTKYTLKE